jgi:hypothetical protein
MFKYVQLQNKDWLYEKYIIEQLTACEIASIVGCKNTIVYTMLNKHGINIRDRRTAQTLKYESDNFKLDLSIIEGGLLGDAMLRCQGKQKNKHKTSQPLFRRKNKFKDHVEWVAEQLCGEWGLNHVKDVSGKMFTGAWCECYEFCTRSHEELMPIYDRWYPEWNGFKKIVPKDFVLDETSLLHWFLDDGSSSYLTKNQGKSKQVKISFSCECFSCESQLFLINQMKQKWNIDAKMKFYRKSATSKINNGDLFRIYIPAHQSDDFYSVIGPPPVKSLEYKWKETIYSEKYLKTLDRRKNTRV